MNICFIHPETDKHLKPLLPFPPHLEVPASVVLASFFPVLWCYQLFDCLFGSCAPCTTSSILSVCLSLSHTHTQRRKWWKTVKVVVLKVGLCGRWWETVVTVELKKAKPRHMLTLKWRIKGIDKGDQAGWLFVHLLIFFRRFDLFLAVKSNQVEPSTIWKS